MGFYLGVGHEGRGRLSMLGLVGTLGTGSFDWCFELCKNVRDCKLSVIEASQYLLLSEYFSKVSGSSHC